MIDYHIHPDYSSDARGTIPDYCARALEVGVRELCFTTHYEPDPARAGIERVVVRGRAVPVDSDWAGFYLEEIAQARSRFPELKIRSGVEIGYEMGLEGKIADFLGRYRFDFVLGAVHCLDHIAITAGHELDDFRARLKPRGAEFIARRYCEYVRAAAGAGLFDCLAHLDIWRKYIVPEMGEVFLKEIAPFIGPMLEHIARSGVGLEINTAALRRGDAEPYPGVELIARAVQAGVRTFTVGSDAHRVEELGNEVNTGIELLAGFGLAPARFEKRRKY